MRHQIVIIYRVSLFFFFKQKTAYEMRISDWSSDVCSSDLHAFLEMLRKRKTRTMPAAMRCKAMKLFISGAIDFDLVADFYLLKDGRGRPITLRQFLRRSEEHTYELQSLMRISYAVFCLKKKKKKMHIDTKIKILHKN